MVTNEKNELPDIYYTTEYGKLCEIIESGKSELFRLETTDGVILHQFIRREIDVVIDGQIYFDIVTPYGYGGPIITRLTGDKSRLLKAFKEEFLSYCTKHRIVSEFVRFHPMLNNALDFDSVYNIQYMRHTVATNLRDYDDPFTKEFGKSCRRSIKKALQQGITFEIIEGTDNLNEFIDIYYETMNRNHAEKFYYFSKEYFDTCLNYFSDHIVLVNAIYEGKTICSEMYFIWNKYIHSHLSGTRSDYLKMAPDYVVMYAITNWGKEKGYHFVHTGGGITNADDDSLYLFKKKFGKNTDFNFYIGKKIWNSEIYNRLCQIKGINNDGFFPAYRKR